mgnify:CR=1 FL=1
MSDPETIIKESQVAYEELLGEFQSVILGTSNPEGTPEASYNPAVMDADRNIYIYVSDLSAHTANILSRKEASVLIIEDEGTCAQVFARKRATFQCEAEEIERDSDRWNAITPLFLDKFGKMFEHLMGMGDFHLIALKPSKGRLVVGFGRAFDISGEKMDEIEHVRGNSGKGHTQAKGHQPVGANS